VVSQYRTLQLSEDLCAKAQTWMPTRFATLEAFVEFLLQEMMREDASKLDEAEEQIVQQRLRDLGYI
jgi:hypothetical protein